MTDFTIYGPATIKHNGTDIGKTNGGGSFSLLTQTYEPIASTYKLEEVVYGIEGQINLFKLTQSVTISSSSNFYDYGEILIELPEGSITLHNAKLMLPNSLSFGQNSQEPFTLRITGGEDSSGNIITIS